MSSRGEELKALAGRTANLCQPPTSSGPVVCRSSFQRGAAFVNNGAAARWRAGPPGSDPAESSEIPQVGARLSTFDAAVVQILRIYRGGGAGPC